MDSEDKVSITVLWRPA